MIKVYFLGILTHQIVDQIKKLNHPCVYCSYYNFNTFVIPN
jgi:wyosine [tRNA(Phe)-imidazoG37] synthetase (radical SAM superfamily)